ncbi:hypothetical protein Tco_1466796 [Tanacetum coccineum]
MLSSSNSNLSSINSKIIMKPFNPNNSFTSSISYNLDSLQPLDATSYMNGFLRPMALFCDNLLGWCHELNSLYLFHLAYEKDFLIGDFVQLLLVMIVVKASQSPVGVVFNLE